MMMTALSGLGALLLGAFGWSFTEYGMHHWNGHLMKGRTMFSREHLRHHAEGDYFAPWGKKLVMAVPIIASITALAVWLVGWVVGLSFVIGFVGTYLGYEVLHRRIHDRPPRTRFGRWARKHHFAHHFNCPKLNHGVTSPIWDHVFRTHRRIDEPVRVPRRLAMVWLLDPETGEPWEAFANDYVVSAPRRARAA